MKIEYRKAAIEDAEVLINIYNAAYYDDYIRYGYCPGYGITKEGMEESIRVFNKYIIMCDNMPVGCVSSKQWKQEYMRLATCASFRSIRVKELELGQFSF